MFKTIALTLITSIAFSFITTSTSKGEHGFSAFRTVQSLGSNTSKVILHVEIPNEYSSMMKITEDYNKRIKASIDNDEGGTATVYDGKVKFIFISAPDKKSFNLVYEVNLSKDKVLKYVQGTLAFLDNNSRSSIKIGNSSN